ncbi:MAG: ATP-dependent DNA helicase UvrD2 [Mycobacteriaceae bacterium]|nr:ATP-dependent DNA helicase UvrD2 [Mycobacteriaceae bacterium]
MAGLDPEQSAAVLAPRGPVCVLAGAGTGKTRTITHRIAHLVAGGHVAAGQVLAVTFTSRAAGEMRHRLAALGATAAAPDLGQVQARTFHAAALRQLRYFWPQVVGDVPWQLLDRKYPVVSQAARLAGLSNAADNVRDLASEIEWAKASLVAPEDYAAAVARHRRTPPVAAAKVEAVYAGYEQLKNGSAGVLLDFDDLLLHTAAALEGHPAVAEEFRDRYRSFVVDEYQDVTPLQQRVLDAWLGDRDDLTVVGDANQTIYSFTGASPHQLLNFSRRFPEATVVRLERDYRSTPQVVTLANRVIDAARGRIAGTRLKLVGQRPPGPEPVFAEYPDEPAEAAAVAEAVSGLIDSGVAAAEIAVLFRVNAQSEAYEQALTERAIAYQVRGGETFFHRTEVRQAVEALRRTATRDDLPEVAGAGLVSLVTAVLVPLGLTKDEPAGDRARERRAALAALVQLTEDLLGVFPDLDLAGLLRELAARADARHPPTVQGVTLASLHAAKGLEWDAVFLVGLADGTLPIAHVLQDGAVDEAGLEEERRLLYVGVTRARVHLRLSWALARGENVRKTRRRSRFLQGLVPDSSPASRIAAPEPVGRRRPGCRVCGAPLLDAKSTLLGRCVGCVVEVDPDLFAALQQWRQDTARDLKMPAFVVFSDNTLTAIAEQQPLDERALVAIPGIGATKLSRFGADVVRIVTKHQNRR